MAEPRTKEELLEDCDNTTSRDELEKKLSGEPDFVLDEYYCAGKGARFRASRLSMAQFTTLRRLRILRKVRCQC